MVVSIHHQPHSASPNFVKQLLLSAPLVARGGNCLCCRFVPVVEDAPGSPSPGNLVVTVVARMKQNHCWKNPMDDSVLIALVLADGDNDLFFGYLSTSITKRVLQISSAFPEPGTSMVVTSFSTLWTNGSDTPMFRLLVKDCRFIQRPARIKRVSIHEKTSKPEDMLVMQCKERPGIDTVTTKFTPEAVENARCRRLVYTRFEGSESAQALARWVWIQENDPVFSESFTRVFTSPSESMGVSSSSCACVEEQGFCRCVLEYCPPTTIDTLSLYKECTQRFRGHEQRGHDKCATCFDELKGSSKRFFMYWWYAIHIYDLRDQEWSLPECISDEIDRMFP